MGEAFGWSELRIEAAVAVDTVSCSVVAGIGAFTVAAVAGTAVAVVVGTADVVVVVAGTAVVVAGIGAFTAAAAVDFRIRLALCGFGSAVGWAQRSNSLGSTPAHCKSPLSSPDS